MNELTRKSPAMATALGFAPAALAVTFLFSGSDGPTGALLWIMFLAAIACCFTSTFMLIRGVARWAVAAALVPMLELLWWSGENDRSLASLWPLFLVTLVCGFTSSFVLFRRATTWTVVAGAAVLLLNVAIAFATGFAALLGGLKW